MRNALETNEKLFVLKGNGDVGKMFGYYIQFKSNIYPILLI